MPVWLRWVLVLPGAVVLTLTVQSIVTFSLILWTSPFAFPLLYLLGTVVTPTSLILSGTWIAPAHRCAVSLSLGGLYGLTVVGAVIADLLQSSVPLGTMLFGAMPGCLDYVSDPAWCVLGSGGVVFLAILVTCIGVFRWEKKKRKLSLDTES